MSVRTDRVRGWIRKEIAAMLLRGEIHDPRLEGLVSITDVVTSRDFNYATVYFTSFGQDAAASLESLSRAAGFIRSQLGRRLKLRHIPELRFKVDDSQFKGERIQQILGSLEIPVPTEEEV